jgi:hypothetical protein
MHSSSVTVSCLPACLPGSLNCFRCRRHRGHIYVGHHIKASDSICGHYHPKDFNYRTNTSIWTMASAQLGLYTWSYVNGDFIAALRDACVFYFVCKCNADCVCIGPSRALEPFTSTGPSRSWPRPRIASWTPIAHPSVDLCPQRRWCRVAAAMASGWPGSARCSWCTETPMRCFRAGAWRTATFCYAVRIWIFTFWCVLCML